MLYLNLLPHRVRNGITGGCHPAKPVTTEGGIYETTSPSQEETVLDAGLVSRAERGNETLG